MVSDNKDNRINLDEDYRCSACGILLSSQYAGDHDGEYCEDCVDNFED